ncbi:MAG: hypothetical protein NVS1B14_03660 [Vulcanimicrobiaceae bacterium]
MRRLCIVVICGIFASLAGALPARAGTTGAVLGRVTDSATSAGIANVQVSIVSASQQATTTTDASGSYRFLSLAPDTYTLSASTPGYTTLRQTGVTVLADQTQTVPLALTKLKEIGAVSSRSTADLVKAGTTSDVYSINANDQAAAASLAGPGGLGTAYGALVSVPGTNVQQGQQGWYQSLSIRGGDIDQVGYELDGIPVNRVYDNAPQTMLSSLGQQELQVYTGGTPATADASGIAGYVNQVVRTGTYPGFATANVAIGGPTFYHRSSVEAGGASPNRMFSYYVGIGGSNQDYRYINNANGAGNAQFFYPVQFPGNFFNLYDGTPGPIFLAPGQTYAIANTISRDSIANVHLGIPHRKDSGRDDLQLLYLNSEVWAKYYSSVNDQGGLANVLAATGGPPIYNDGFVYTGAMYSPPSAANIVPYFFPSSPQNRAPGLALSRDARDSNDNGVAVTKLQYQRNFNSRSFLRMYGYTVYSNWFIYGLANQNFTGWYGAELNLYELPSHTYGANVSYSNQLSDKHLITASLAYTTAKVERRFSYGFPGNSNGAPFTNLVDPATGNCYNPTTGARGSCFDSSIRGTLPTQSGPAMPTLPITATASSAFAASGISPQWLVTDNGFVNTRFNTVSPTFTAASLTDQIHPNDRLTINAGVRVENYSNALSNTTGTAARAFWFRAYNQEYCYKPGALNPINIFQSSGLVANAANCATLGSGWRPANLVNDSGGTVSATVVQPRLAFTYAYSPDTVLRGSYGVYARPVNTSWLQYNAIDQNLASFIGNNFLSYGYNSPRHNLVPDTSYNADLSLERHLRGTDFSFKLSPFYRSAHNQLQPVPIGVGGVVSGFNVGRQTSYGLEVALRKGDFARDGFAGQLAYTYTHSRITYSSFPSGTNVIDSLNQYIQEYNSYTSGCATITPANTLQCGGVSSNAQPKFTNAGVTVTNPYFTQKMQPLLDRNGSYTTYDQIPQPFTGENGYETPHVLAAILSWKHDRWNITPSLTFTSGAFYGSPLSYPGFNPSGCTAALPPVPGNATPADPKSCTGSSSTVSGLPFLMIPDAFTGKFDNLGAFKQPSRLTLNLNLGYQASPRVKVNAYLTGLIDKCFQRGYAWDYSDICSYSSLPSSFLSPTGGTLANAAAGPIQQKFPYAMWLNNNNTGFVGVKIPMQASLNIQFKM